MLACINQSAALFCIMYMHGEASLSGFALCVKLGVSSCIGAFYMICCMFWATDDACFVPPVWFFLSNLLFYLGMDEQSASACSRTWESTAVFLCIFAGIDVAFGLVPLANLHDAALATSWPLSPLLRSISLSRVHSDLVTPLFLFS